MLEGFASRCLHELLLITKFRPGTYRSHASLNVDCGEERAEQSLLCLHIVHPGSVKSNPVLLGKSNNAEVRYSLHICKYQLALLYFRNAW